MSLIFGIFYLPALLVLTISGLRIISRYEIKNLGSYGYKVLLLPIIFGSLATYIITMTLACITTVLLVPYFPVGGHELWVFYFYRAGFELIFPFFVSLIILFISFKKFKSQGLTKKILLYNRMGIGAMHIVWLLPLSVLIYSYSPLPSMFLMKRELRERMSSYNEVSAHSEIKICSKNNVAKGIYFSKRPPRHVSPMLEQLEFIELPIFGYVNKEKYPYPFVRLTIDKDKEPYSNGHYPIKRQNILELDSDFEVKSTLQNTGYRHTDAVIDKTVVTNRKTGELIARFTIVDGGPGYRSPPGDLGLKTNLLAYILGFMLEEKRETFEPELLKYLNVQNSKTHP